MARRTQAIIMQAFIELLTQKSLDKITVKDVIERADINRNTFYYYYENIPSLLDTLFEQELQKFTASTEKRESFAKEYVRAYSLVQNNKRAIYHIYQSGERQSLSRFLETAAELFVESFVREAAVSYDLDENGIYYVTHFYSYIIVGMTSHWVREDMPSVDWDLPERIESSFYASADSIIRDYIHFNAVHGAKPIP